MEIAQRFLLLVDKVGHNEALHGKALHYDEPGNAPRTMRRCLTVILRNSTAAGDAALVVHAEQNRFEDIAANIVEINVDALGRHSPQSLADRFFLVVDGMIKSEIAFQHRAFFVAACNADHRAAFELGNLPDDRSHRSRCR